MGVKNVTVRQALQYVADHPDLETDNFIELPAHELICRTLFDLANGAQLGNPASLNKANAARNLIFQRMVGRRKPGTHPVRKQQRKLEFRDLTGEGK